MTTSTDFRPYESVRQQSYRLELVERWLMIHSSWFLLAAVMIAGLDLTTGGWLTGHVPGVFFFWAVVIVLGTDTQIVQGVGMAQDALADKRRWAGLAWCGVVLALAIPAAIINTSFGLVDMRLASTEFRALAMLHIGPFGWAILRGVYGVVLFIISKATRPHVERVVASSIVVPPPDKPVASKRQNRPTTRVARPDRRTGRSSAKQVAMAAWRMAKLKRLVGNNAYITARQAARELTYQDPDTGEEFPCHHQTANSLLQKIKLEALQTQQTAQEAA